MPIAPAEDEEPPEEEFFDDLVEFAHWVREFVRFLAQSPTAEGDSPGES